MALFDLQGIILALTCCLWLGNTVAREVGELQTACFVILRTCDPHFCTFTFLSESEGSCTILAPTFT